MSDLGQPYFMQALDALKAGDRRRAAGLLARQLEPGRTSAKNLPSVSQLAAHIGEVDLAIEAMRQAVIPGQLDSLLAYWAALSTYGRADKALAEASTLPPAIQDQPSVLHFRGTAATEVGRFAEAEELFRRALAKAPGLIQTWFALAMVKTFVPGDDDLAAMDRLERSASGSPEARASLCYAIGKAHDDCGEPECAFEFYTRGAALRRQGANFDAAAFGRAADNIIRDFAAERIASLAPSGFTGQAPLFVTGMPRSGTTLVEHMLLSHSTVSNGGEINLFAPAAMPCRGYGLGQALSYQQHGRSPDPWGDIARDYTDLVRRYFQSPRGRVVDKSLGQSMSIGIMLHALPDARIAWLRRNPDDVALSCFRTYFSTGLPWTSSLSDIALVMRAEDKLFAHWHALFPDRILPVRYEELVRGPATWSERLQQHFALPVEEGLETASKEGRAVGTASTGQVRGKISTTRIGQADRYQAQLKPFRDLYYA